MAQDLGEQINTIERSLGERMIEHALVIVRSWLNELGENNPYEEAFKSIQQRYRKAFDEWLTADDTQNNEELNDLTGEMYQLSDAVYAAIRVHRGLSPLMHGFNPGSAQSVINYFANCVEWKESDLEWLRSAMNDPDRSALALLAAGSLSKNLRECFSLDAIMVLMDAMNGKNDVVADQCIAYVCMLLIHYDIRMDFFPQLQEAFVEAYAQTGSGDRVFEVLCALVRSSHRDRADKSEEKVSKTDLPDELVQLMDMVGMNSEQGVQTWMPQSEAEYIEGLVDIFPDTWLYKMVMEEDSAREQQMALTYLSIGRMDMLWGYPEVAERFLKERLRKNSQEVCDYINYGHLQLLKGDKMLAYAYYRQARNMCSSVKTFYSLFRPGRSALADCGVPLDQIYLIEDQLLQTDN